MWNIGNGFVENNICLGFYHVHPILATGIFTHPRPNPAALRQSGQRIYLVLRRETPVCRKWESSLVSGFNPSQNLSEFSGESSAIRMEKKRNIWNHHIWSGPPWIKKHGFPGTLQWGAGISFPVVPKPPCSASGKKRWRFHPVPCVSCMSGWYLHTPSKNHVPLPKSSQFSSVFSHFRCLDRSQPGGRLTIAQHMHHTGTFARG